MKHKTPEHEPHQDVPVDDPAGPIAALQAEVARLEDARLRAEADLQNVRRRAAREHEDAERRGEERVLNALFAVIDDLERARDAAGAESAVKAGIELVLQRAREELARLGVSPIHPHGEPFDPHAHDALLSAESAEHDAGHVSHVISPGYRREHDGRVVRHAKVQVSTGLGSSTEPGGEKRS